MACEGAGRATGSAPSSRSDWTSSCARSAASISFTESSRAVACSLASSACVRASGGGDAGGGVCARVCVVVVGGVGCVCVCIQSKTEAKIAALQAQLHELDVLAKVELPAVRERLKVSEARRDTGRRRVQN